MAAAKKDQRLKERVWPVVKENGEDLYENVQYTSASLAVLMDLRDLMRVQIDELKRLNALLHTPGLNSDMWGPSWLTAYIKLAGEHASAQTKDTDNG